MEKSELDIFLGRNAEIVASELIGCILHYLRDGLRVSGKIVETEAYTSLDPASHSSLGVTKRNKPMFGPPGTLYIYFIYGMHYCFNIVTGKSDGQAVLIRAIEPINGIEIMKRRRSKATISSLCNGPAKLVQAFGITSKVNNQNILEAGFSLEYPAIKPKVISGPRIGISKATTTAWNYQLAGSKFVSR